MLLLLLISHVQEVTDVPNTAMLHRIEDGMVTITAAGMGGWIEE